MMVTLRIDTSKIDEDFVSQLGSSRRRSSDRIEQGAAVESADGSETPAAAKSTRD
jgi:hypothetical protein